MTSRSQPSGELFAMTGTMAAPSERPPGDTARALECDEVAGMIGPEPNDGDP